MKGLGEQGVEERGERGRKGAKRGSSRQIKGNKGRNKGQGGKGGRGAENPKRNGGGAQGRERLRKKEGRETSPYINTILANPPSIPGATSPPRYPVIPRMPSE